MAEIGLSEILSRCDHTILSTTATSEEILRVVEDGIKFGVASVCIPPSFVAEAAKHAAGRVKICTVIGFPNGYSTTGAKVFEAGEAVRLGADEIDMVVNLGAVKSGRFDEILCEINAVKDACEGRLLKVIIETSELTDEQKRMMCRTVSLSRADFIKTSTGFSSGGATFEDVALMKECMSEGKRIKASGGIASLEDAAEFIRLGADRLGTSKIVRIAKEKLK